MVRRGTVVEFSFDRGLGRVRDVDGVEWPFHCTAIADGSRQIELNAEVSFEVVAGHHGQREATDLRVA